MDGRGKHGLGDLALADGGDKLGLEDLMRGADGRGRCGELRWSSKVVLKRFFCAAPSNGGRRSFEKFNKGKSEGEQASYGRGEEAIIDASAAALLPSPSSSSAPLYQAQRNLPPPLYTSQISPDEDELY